MLCWATLTWFTTAYYYHQYNDLLDRMRGSVLTVNIGVYYGNRTMAWYDTPALIGMNLFEVTSRVANLTYSGTYGTGVSTTSINGVENSHPYYWIFYCWNSTQGWFEPTYAAADQHIVKEGESFLWFYENTTTVDNVAKG